jgi:D-amino-acid oxidase
MPRSTNSFGRRQFIAGAGAALLTGALEGCGIVTPNASRQTGLVLPRLHASTDRITGITVCTRPFRA